MSEKKKKKKKKEGGKEKSMWEKMGDFVRESIDCCIE